MLYLNDYNEQVMRKIFKENGLEFAELFQCETFVYLWGGHPLALSLIHILDLTRHLLITS